MNNKNDLAIPEDQSLEQAYQKYQLLKQEVEHWQQDRGAYWLKQFRLADRPPYLAIPDLPNQAVLELWQRLNQAAEVVVADSVLQEIWERFKYSQSLNELDPEMAARFQMVVNGVTQLASEMVKEQGLPTESSDASDAPQCGFVCPVCGEVPELAIVTPPDGARVMHCLSCNFEWPVKRVGCLFCGSQDAKQQIFLKNESFPGIEMVVCQLCGQYFKEIDTREKVVTDYRWEDLRTLPLNFATELWFSEQAKKNNQMN